MRAISIFLHLVIFNVVFTSVKAQVSVSGEPRAQADHKTGEVVILPAAHAPEVGLESQKLVLRNIAQIRTDKMGKGRNGYYQMSYAQDWGTGARINQYGFTDKDITETTKVPAGAVSEKSNQKENLANVIATLAVFKWLAFGFSSAGLGQMPLLD